MNPKSFDDFGIDCFFVIFVPFVDSVFDLESKWLAQFSRLS